MSRVLVCGGRDYESFEAGQTVYATLDRIFAEDGISLIIHGACKTGADSYAELWAKGAEVAYLGIPAKWKAHGKAAGPLRNAEMLKRSKPDRIIAFPGGRGTANMVLLAEKAGIPVTRIGAS